MATAHPSRTRVLIAGISALILTLGVGRFAFTPMLGPMKAQAGLAVDAAGWLAGWNYAGYFLGVLVLSRMKNLTLKDRLFRAGLVLAVVTTGMMALGDSLWLWGLSRFLAGVAAAAGLIAGSGLVLNWLLLSGHRGELGVHFMGSGLGIVVGGALVGMTAGTMAWQAQWWLLTAVAVLVAVPAWRWLPPPPAVAKAKRPAGPVDGAVPPAPVAWLALLHGAYFCAGLGYVVSATFTVLAGERVAALAGHGGWLWLLVGATAAPSPVLWDRLARRVGYLTALQVAFALQALGIAAPVVFPGLAGTLVAAVLYGGTFMGIVSLVLTTVGVRFPDRPAQVMAQLTLSFGVAQIVGPVLAGELAAMTGHFELALGMTAVAMLVGLGCLVGLRFVPDRAPLP